MSKLGLTVLKYLPLAILIGLFQRSIQKDYVTESQIISISWLIYLSCFFTYGLFLRFKLKKQNESRFYFNYKTVRSLIRNEPIRNRKEVGLFKLPYKIIIYHFKISAKVFILLAVNFLQ